MNSDKFDALLSTLPNLQNLDFHLTKVPNDKINRKEEKEMERTFSHNTKVCIVYVLSIILIISAFMWAMDLCYNVSLFLPLFVTILFTLIVIIATCLALCELEL